MSTSPTSYSACGSTSKGLYCGILASLSAVRADSSPASASNSTLPVGPFSSWFDELSAFADHLRRGVHEASEHNLALDGEVGDTLRRFGRNTGEHRGSFGSATVIAGTVKQGILIQEHPLLTQCIDERDVQGHATGESNGGRQAIILDRDAHRVQQHRQRVALPLWPRRPRATTPPRRKSCVWRPGHPARAQYGVRRP